MRRGSPEITVVMSTILVITSTMAHDQRLFSLTESCLDKNSADVMSGVRSQLDCMVKCRESECVEAVYEKMAKRCYLSDKISTKCSTSTQTFRDVSRYEPDGYAQLLTSDYSRVVPEQSHCLSLCSVNQTCAAVSYDGNTSTCFMSSIPTFLNKSDVEPKAFLKEMHKGDLTVVQFRTDLTTGGSTLSSTIYDQDRYSSNAIDGRYFHNPNDGPEHLSLFATEMESLPWLQVHLTATHWIVGIKLWNRKSFPDQTINDAQVHVADGDEDCSTFPEEARCGEWTGRPTVNPVFFECVKAMLGKCVKITGHDQALAIREVEVHGWRTY